MKILQVHKYFHERDGAGRYMLGLTHLLEDAGHQVAHFAMHTPENLPTPWSKYFVSHINTKRVSFGFYAFKQFTRAIWSHQAAKKMDAILHDFLPDIVHIHNIYTHLSPSVLAVAKRRGIPVVMTVHDYALLSADYALWDISRPLPFSIPSFWTVLKTHFIKNSYIATGASEAILRLHRLLKCYDGVVSHYLAPSLAIKRALLLLGIHESRITMAYPPITAPSRSSASVANQQPSSARGGVLFVGRLERYKGIETLIAAMENKRLAKTQLRIVGIGPDEARLKNLAKGMTNVTFVGFASGAALWAEYQNAMVSVVPSLWYEPFGLVALEAMVRGVPVIVSNRGGLPEIVEDGVSGLVFKAAVVGDLAAKLTLLVNDAQLASKIGEAGKKRAKTLGNPQKHLKTVLAVYSQISA
jgi:glycosyltransferase involved in cell wall biosynthesis